MNSFIFSFLNDNLHIIQSQILTQIIFYEIFNALIYNFEQIIYNLWTFKTEEWQW